MNNWLLTIKKTSLGGALAWLARPVKHRNDIRSALEHRLPYPPSRQQVRWCFWDYCRFRLLYKGDLETDYFGARLYRKSDFVRRQSLAHHARFAWRDAIQEKSLHPIFLDKKEFYQAFSDHLNRPWMCADGHTGVEELRAFVQGCENGFFTKPLKGCGGRQVRFWTQADDSAPEQLQALCAKAPLILEGRLTQSEDLRAFYPDAVNTLRILTIVDDAGRPHVARAELRMGRGGMVVDNYSSGGLVAQVDVGTGVIFTAGNDADGTTYLFHPDSGKQIVGYVIPHWEDYKDFVRTLAARYPAMRYVGWDVIRDSEGRFCVIEGNKDAGVGGLESSLLYGLRPLFDQLLHAQAEDPRP